MPNNPHSGGRGTCFTAAAPRTVLGTFSTIVKAASVKKQFVVPQGLRVEQWRLHLGWTQDKLAHRSGVGKTAIWEIESQFRPKFIVTMDLVAKALGVTVTDVIVTDAVIRRFPQVPDCTESKIGWVVDCDFEIVVDLVELVITDFDGKGSLVHSVLPLPETSYPDKAVATIENALEHLVQRNREIARRAQAGYRVIARRKRVGSKP